MILWTAVLNDFTFQDFLFLDQLIGGGEAGFPPEVVARRLGQPDEPVVQLRTLRTGWLV